MFHFNNNLMMKVKHLVAMATVCMALFHAPLNASAQTASGEDPDKQYATELVKPGTQAPSLAGKALDGTYFSLAKLKGNYVVLDFWASWCPDCRKDAPNVVRMYQKYKGKKVKFVGVSFDTDATAWKAAVDRYGMTYTHVSDLKKMRESAYSKAFGVKWIPSMIVVDPKGKVVLSTVVSEKVDAFLAKVLK